MTNQEHATVHPDHAELMRDREVSAYTRVKIARDLIRRFGYSELGVLLSSRGLSDGTPIPDRYLTPADEAQITDSLGFRENTYKKISPYEFHTPSATDGDLTLKIADGPLGLGGATELFPNGLAFSQYDCSTETTIVVSK